MTSIIRIILVYFTVLYETEGSKHKIVIDVNHGWQPVFFGFIGIGQSVYDAWVTPHRQVCRLADGCFTSVDNIIHFKQHSHLRSQRLNYWTRLNVDVVKLELFLGGHRKVWILFDGRNSNITSWFSRGNFMNSNYKDLSQNSHFDVFSIQGEENMRRRFVISESLSGCENTLGWLFISDGPTTACNWNATYGHYPVFFYSNLDRKTQFGTGTTGIADLLMISIKKTKIKEQSH